MQTRSSFHKSLVDIQNEVMVMANSVQNHLQDSVTALSNRDLRTAITIINADKNINRNRFEIEEKCIQLIATQQPIAGDLRIILGALNIISELERIGDYGVAISKIVLIRGDDHVLKPEFDIEVMTKMVGDMLKQSMEAFKKGDSEEEKLVNPIFQ
jgi:phosphate transport system protein